MKSTKKRDPFERILTVFFIIFSLQFVIPLLVIINASLMSSEGISEYGFTIIPKMFDFSAYQFVFKNPKTILTGYKVSIMTSAISLVLYMFMGAAAAYALSNKKFAFRKAFAFYLFFTMLFRGGMAPTYIWMTKYLHLQNTMWALILPLLGNVWWIFIMRTFFQQLPESLSESAIVDGASEFTIFFKIILPLSKPVMATIGVMSLLMFWSSWMPALLYIKDKDLIPLQYLLQIMLRNLQTLLQEMDQMPMAYTETIPDEPVRMAMAIIAAGPMLIIFPFFQKYFTKGMTVGSVKG